MRRKSILAALAAATLALALAAPVGALNRDQAHRAAMSYIHDRCGNFWYACQGFTLGVLIGTGVNQAGKPQWFFIGMTTSASSVLGLVRRIGCVPSVAA